MISGNNKILTTAGYKTISTLKGTVKTFTCGDNNNLIEKEVEVENIGMGESYCVNVANVPPIIGDPNLKIMVLDPFQKKLWKKLTDLSVGDKIVYPEHRSLYHDVLDRSNRRLQKVNLKEQDLNFQLAGEYSSIFGELKKTKGGFSPYRKIAEETKKHLLQNRRVFDVIMADAKPNQVVSYLRGLFSQDATVKINKEKYICLISDDLQFLYDIQLLLKQFQIFSRVVKDDLSKHYPKLKIHHLRYLKRFYRDIGFIQKDKMDKLKFCLDCFRDEWFEKHFYGSVIDIIEASPQEMYKIHGDEVIANGSCVDAQES